MSKRVRPLAALIIIAFSTASAAFPVHGETYAHRSYSWSYAGIDWTWSLDIPQSLYSGYASVSELSRKQGEVNGYLVTTEDTFIRSIATSFRQAASKEGYGSYDEASLLLAWVQSLPYTVDSVTSPYDDYPRFPVQTLYANGGDCEDTVYLYLTIMRIWGYGSVFINPPQHLAAGILGDNNLQGSYYEYQGKHYYYAETTGDGYAIGEIPDVYSGVSARIWPVTVAGYVPSWNGATTPSNPSTTNPQTPNQPGATSEPGLVDSIVTALIPYALILGTILALSITIRVWEQNKKRNIALPPPVASYCSSCGEPMAWEASYCAKCGRARSAGIT